MLNNTSERFAFAFSSLEVLLLAAAADDVSMKVNLK